MDDIKLKPVVVTTEHRGVFFGYVPEDTEPVKEQLTLVRARNCVYWSASVKGFAGLAVTGPDSQCKIGPAVPKLTLFDITSVADVTPEAAQKWEAGPWAR